MSKPAIEGRGGKRRKAGEPRNAEASRTRIFEAAKVLFSGSSYEGVGLREIAAAANVDPALIMRYFGTKEGLFREVAANAFGADEFLARGAAGLPDNAAVMLLSDMDDKAWRSGYDPLRLLLSSIGSPTAGPILGDHLDAGFVQPLAAAAGGTEARERGVMLAAHIVGLALMRIALAGSSQLSIKPEVLKRLLRKSMEATLQS